jgi:hypothetical protein
MPSGPSGGSSLSVYPPPVHSHLRCTSQSLGLGEGLTDGDGVGFGFAAGDGLATDVAGGLGAAARAGAAAGASPATISRARSRAIRMWPGRRHDRSSGCGRGERGRIGLLIVCVIPRLIADVIQPILVMSCRAVGDAGRGRWAARCRCHASPSSITRAKAAISRDRMPDWGSHSGSAPLLRGRHMHCPPNAGELTLH